MIVDIQLVDGGQFAVDQLSLRVLPRIGETVEFEGIDGLYIVQSVRHSLWGLSGDTPRQQITLVLYRF
jgi:hypothetical protein